MEPLRPDPERGTRDHLTEANVIQYVHSMVSATDNRGEDSPTVAGPSFVDHGMVRHSLATPVVFYHVQSTRPHGDPLREGPGSASGERVP